MVVPMKKLTLLVLQKEKREALINLRKLGLVHVEQGFPTSDEISKLKTKKDELALAMNLFKEFMPKKADKNPPSIMNEEESLNLLDSVISLNNEYKKNQEDLANVSYLLEYYRAWGDLDIKDFEKIKEKGVFLFPVTLPAKAYNALGDDIQTIYLGRNKKDVNFLVWSDDEDVLKKLPAEAIMLKMPETSVKDLRNQKVSLHKKLEAYHDEMTRMSVYLNSFEALDKIITKKLNFELVSESMELIDLEKKRSRGS